MGILNVISNTARQVGDKVSSLLKKAVETAKEKQKQREQAKPSSKLPPPIQKITTSKTAEQTATKTTTTTSAGVRGGTRSGGGSATTHSYKHVGTQVVTAEIPQEERIVKEPTTFQKVVGMITSPFSTHVTEKYTSPQYPLYRAEMYSVTPTGKGTAIIQSITPISEAEYKRDYPQAYYAREIQEARYKAERTAESTYQSRIGEEFQKAIVEVGLGKTVILKGDQVEYIGSPEQYESAKASFEKAKTIAHERALSFATAEATKQYESEVKKSVFEFEKGFKEEQIKFKPYDITYQAGLTFVTGFAGGSAVTSLSYAVPPAVTKGLTAGAVVGGGFLAYKEIKEISREYKETREKFGEDLARKELALNVAGLGVTTASSIAGWTAGSKYATAQIMKTQRVELERGVFVAKEIDRGTVVGVEVVGQKVKYDVNLPFLGKRTITETRLINYPFIIQTPSRGVGGSGAIIGSIGRTDGGVVSGYNVLFRTAEGSKLLGKPPTYFERGVSFQLRGEATPGVAYTGRTNVLIYRQFGGIFKEKQYFIKSLTLKPKTTAEGFISVSRKKFSIFGKKEEGGMMLKLGEGSLKIRPTTEIPYSKVYQETVKLGPKGFEEYYSQKAGVIFGKPKEIKPSKIFKPSIKFTQEPSTITSTMTKTQTRIFPTITPKVQSLTISKTTNLIAPSMKVRNLYSKVSTSAYTPKISTRQIGRTYVTPSLKMKTIPTQKSISFISSGSRQRQRIVPSQRIAEMQIEKIQTELLIKPQNLPRTAFRTPSLTSFGFMPLPPSFISFSLPRGRSLSSGFQKSFLGKRSYKYQPSFSAIVLGIRSPKIPKSYFTGITIRPIVR